SRCTSCTVSFDPASQARCAGKSRKRTRKAPSHPLRPEAVMTDLSPILLAGLTGFVSGLLLSVPVGPINLTIINEGARRGFYWAALIGLGATVMEVIYCFVAFTGFASFFTRGYIKAIMELGSFVFMLY